MLNVDIFSALRRSVSGGLDAEAAIQYSSLTSGYASLAQMNVVVPDLPAGEAAVQISVGGAANNTTNISITNAK